MRAVKEMDCIVQDLLDWLFEKSEEEIPIIEEMKVWLVRNYNVGLGRKELEEIRSVVAN